VAARGLAEEEERQRLVEWRMRSSGVRVSGGGGAARVEEEERKKNYRWIG
jgi:hypothetical protein